jgi:hypothetical protein
LDFFNQTIDIQTATPKKFKVVASVGGTDEGKAWAGVWVREDTKDRENGFEYGR